MQRILSSPFPTFTIERFHPPLSYFGPILRSSFQASMTAQSSTTTQEETLKPWHAHFPAPRTTSPNSLTREELLGKLKAGEKGGREFLLVDLRRDDFKGGTISSSLNLPAQTLYPSLPTLYNLCAHSETTRTVIFYCGSSSGRGTRAASWFADYIDDVAASGEEVKVESVILKAGIKGWVAGGEEYIEWMEGFEEGVWKKEAEGGK
ncbi:hypothetical protein H2200_004792 [Cladophialophora chaetospira]|uniref:Rhodanese domain-containing protein n=1 Tax=Cladophialophora chaetospira TaxID=386627 RepID=A0AA38XDR8_9EURO|nr:hypothetical protein H2200_004792 [Cladophialophora chaetospira]